MQFENGQQGCDRNHQTLKNLQAGKQILIMQPVTYFSTFCAVLTGQAVAHDWKPVLGSSEASFFLTLDLHQNSSNLTRKSCRKENKI